jgi:hypothetical protein
MPRLPATLLGVLLLCLAPVLPGAAQAVEEPPPSAAKFNVQEASCGYDPTRDVISAKGLLRTRVYELESNRTHYLRVRLRLEHAKPGGAWKLLAMRKSESNALWKDSLPFPWTAAIRSDVPAGVADHDVLRLRFRVTLMQAREGDDKPVWRHHGRSSDFECGDGRL